MPSLCCSARALCARLTGMRGPFTSGSVRLHSATSCRSGGRCSGSVAGQALPALPHSTFLPDGAVRPFRASSEVDHLGQISGTAHDSPIEETRWEAGRGYDIDFQTSDFILTSVTLPRPSFGLPAPITLKFSRARGKVRSGHLFFSDLVATCPSASHCLRCPS